MDSLLDLYILACDKHDLLDIFDDRKMYKICNTFYHEFGMLLADFYNHTVMPNKEQISLDGTLW